ncbi:hypothetical protein AT05_02700 [Schleiferia thermophila str. Yellowstone]|nr:hypothetical protein AT05_02700 [Schleiferia thermophila str. Yellowstone]
MQLNFLKIFLFLEGGKNVNKNFNKKDVLKFFYLKIYYILRKQNYVKFFNLNFKNTENQ